MENCSNTVLLGDEGYKLTQYLMIPFKTPANMQQTNFNKKHILARLKIEHAFGQLKSRFPILHYGIRAKLNKAPSIIAAAIVLHNIAKFLKEENDFDDVLVIPFIHDLAINDDETVRIRGEMKRNQLAGAMQNQD